jgi:hypothetical protein
MTCAPRKQSKTYKVPKRPYEAARLDAELKVGDGVWDMNMDSARAVRRRHQDIEGVGIAGKVPVGLTRRTLYWRLSGHSRRRLLGETLLTCYHSSPESTVSETSERSGEFSLRCPR